MVQRLRSFFWNHETWVLIQCPCNKADVPMEGQQRQWVWAPLSVSIVLSQQLFWLGWDAISKQSGCVSLMAGDAEHSFQVFICHSQFPWELFICCYLLTDYLGIYFFGPLFFWVLISICCGVGDVSSVWWLLPLTAQKLLNFTKISHVLVLRVTSWAFGIFFRKSLPVLASLSIFLTYSSSASRFWV